MTKVAQGPAGRVANAFDSMVVGSGTAINLGAALNGGAQLRCMEVMVQVTGQTAAFIGNEFNQFFRLAQYDSITIPINNVASISIRTDAGTSDYNWIAMT